VARAVSLTLPRPRATSSLARVAIYTATRGVALFLTTVVGIYLTILVANMGGYVDQIKRAEIREQVALAASMNEQIRRLPVDVRERVVAEMIRVEERRLGLDRPFLVRSLRYLQDALLLRLGFAERMTSDSGSRLVRSILLDRLPSTLLLFATTSNLLFFVSVALALTLSRQYGSFWDRLVVALAPLSAPPAWFYGIFLILIFAAWLRWLPFGGMVDAPPPEGKLAYALSVLKHMVLPASAITLTSLPLAVYSWRTFFLIFSSEDYVELARAKGLPGPLVERRYILRPALPTLLTNFALGLIGAWTGAIVLETVFNWPGLGRTLYQAVGLADTPVIVGATVLYAYLLALTVFLLDVAYAIVDPRVRVGG
jgi:peptide/nickel transport system permease protein